MEMLDGSRRLMEEERGEEKAGGHALNTFIPQRDTRQQRMAQFLAVALLLMISAALALLITILLGGRSHPSPDSKLMMQPDSHSSGSSSEYQEQKDDKNPSAMLTAPRGNNTDGEYLEWDSEVGHAFCHGGFSYSSGDLVVPRKGIYRVFLQITYESKDGSKCDKQEKLTNSVFIFQDNYNENVHLLSSVDTVSCSLKPWSKSLYTAGLFSLDAQGRLRVTSSHRNLIVKKEYQVFFGAELLSQ